MSQTNTCRTTLNAATRILTSLALVFAASLAARAQHDMQNMPGMKMSKPKAKPRAKQKTKPKAKPTARRKKSARVAPKKDDMKGMDMSMPMQSQSQTATPSPSPAKTGMEKMPGMTMPAAPSTPAASASPQKPDMNNMPGMQMPAAPPPTIPQVSPSPDQKMDMPMNMPMNNPNPQASPSPGGMTGMKPRSMPGMKTEGGMTSMSESDVTELMVMSNDSMGVRVGASKTNVVPMGQMGSGTSWQPSESPLNMIHRRAGDWLLMFHYDAKIGVNRQGGARGATKFESSNWFMPMAYHKLGRGTLQLRAMLSLEPLTFSGAGSPELFQTGEARHGQPLIDVQHPHDLFMELSAQYQVALGERATWFAYAGYPGEPALGPVAFMHRASASENPTAPLAHHLEDSTHISYGVVTSGFTYRWFKLEGSIFNGREPDERRFNFEAHPWTSRSARLSFAPNANWTFQVSHGFLRNPEELEPGDTRRTTASVQYDRKFARGNVASALIWGRNHETQADGARFNLNGYTFETTVNFIERNYLYTRLELVDKNGLLRPADLARLGFASGVEQPTFRIGAYTFGYVRDLFERKDWLVGLGGDSTFYSKPNILDQIYGANPVSYKIFLRIRPGHLKMDEDMQDKLKEAGQGAGVKHEH